MFGQFFVYEVTMCCLDKYDLENIIVIIIVVTNRHGYDSDRHHCFKSGDIPKTEGGQINLNVVTAL